MFFSLSSHFLSSSVPDINLNSPNKGLGVDHSDSLADVPVEGAVGNSANPLPPGLTEEEAEELRTELMKVKAQMSENHPVFTCNYLTYNEGCTMC